MLSYSISVILHITDKYTKHNTAISNTLHSVNKLATSQHFVNMDILADKFMIEVTVSKHWTKSWYCKGIWGVSIAYLDWLIVHTADG